MDTTKTPAAPAAETTAAPVVKIVTSPKLVELEAKKISLGNELKTKDVGGKDWNDIIEALQTNRKEQAAEIVAINKAEADQRLAELRQERVKFIDDFAAAVLADAKKPTDETKGALQAAKEVLVNLVLPNHAAKKADSGDSSAAPKGEKTAKILAELTSRINAGMTPSAAVKEVVALGYAVGTVGSVRTANWPAK